ncbi:MAG TPA: efflux RND transporter periplasmic adaptor subunit [Xanthobacteraceae bacterium]|nr:efflux RND transporter periplasmic adaptor subunit [Xanthobacteraceae bacterium]
MSISMVSKHSRVLLLLAGLSPTLLLGGCDDTVAQKELPTRPVLVTTVSYQPEAPQRSFVGTIRPRVETDMGFRVGGKVAQRLVEVGDLVTAGQPLATLDSTDLKLQAEQAEAEFRAATGVLAQAAAAEARAKELRARGWSTEAQMDQARAMADEARARFSRAERSVELTKNSLAYANLLADSDGVVTAALINPGQVVAAGQAAIRVARSAEKEAVVSIPETLLARAENGTARVALWSDPDKSYVARLREISPAADPMTRTYQAKFSLPEADDAVKLGMTATVRLSAKDGERIARLPLAAVLDQGKGPNVFVVDRANGHLKMVPVQVKSFDASSVTITGGVDNGATVVALGVQKLDPGQKVRVVSSLAF